eukprot:Tbor_TRINITY_DN6132_c1_g1::TRINITY_DN6132_c1_g1_i5::g.22720::m.22720
MSQFRPALLLVLLLHVSSLGVYVKGEPSDSKSVQDVKAAEVIKKAQEDANFVMGKATESEKAVQRIIDESKEARARFQSAEAAKDHATENVEEAKQAIKEVEENLKTAEAEAEKPNASEDAKKALTAAKAKKTAMDNALKEANDRLIQYSAELEKAKNLLEKAENAISAADVAAGDAFRAGAQAQDAADEIKSALEKGDKAPDEAMKALEGLVAAAKAKDNGTGVTDTKSDKVVSGDGVGDVIVRVSDPKGPNIGIPETNGPNHGKGKPSATRTVEGTKPDTPKIKTDKAVKSPVNSASSISSTIPAVLITSVVFLYFNNW